APAPRAPPGRGDPGGPASDGRRRPQPGRGVLAPGRRRRCTRRGGDGAVKLREIALVAGKELRETLRDRRTLAVMVLFPLVIYPLVSLVTAQVLAARVARVESHVARVAVEGPPALTRDVQRRLQGPDLIVAPP